MTQCRYRLPWTAPRLLPSLELPKANMRSQPFTRPLTVIDQYLRFNRSPLKTTTLPVFACRREALDRWRVGLLWKILRRRPPLQNVKRALLLFRKFWSTSISRESRPRHWNWLCYLIHTRAPMKKEISQLTILLPANTKFVHGCRTMTFT